MRIPIQLRDLVLRPQVRRGIAMAIQAEGHAQWFGVINLFHLVDLAMAMHATDPAIHMHGVIEVHVVRHFMDLHPRNRLAGLGAFPNQRQPRIILEHLIVAIHAGGTGRDIRIPGLLHRAVAITAVQSELIDVDGMREPDRLDRLIPDAGIFRCEVVPDARRDSRADQQRADDNVKRQPVRPFREDI